MLPGAVFSTPIDHHLLSVYFNSLLHLTTNIHFKTFTFKTRLLFRSPKILNWHLISVLLTIKKICLIKNRPAASVHHPNVKVAFRKCEFQCNALTSETG